MDVEEEDTIMAHMSEEDEEEWVELKQIFTVVTLKTRSQSLKTRARANMEANPKA